MAGTMSEADLVADLKASLFDSAELLESEGDQLLKRCLTQALPDMEVKRPLTRLGSLTLVADQARYEVQEGDFAAFKTDLWRDPQRLPKLWDPCYPGPLPRILCPQRDGDAWFIAFDPAPTSAQISALGTAFKFYYFAHHTIGAEAAGTTVAGQDRGLLLLRAQAEAMLAVAVRNAGKPVQLRDGLTGVARNSTPSAIYQALLAQFRDTR